MLIPLDSLVSKYKIHFKGILHIGAHECEEMMLYEKYIPRDKILWVEALEDKVNISRFRYPGIWIENAVVSDKIETVDIKIHDAAGRLVRTIQDKGKDYYEIKTNNFLKTPL